MYLRTVFLLDRCLSFVKLDIVDINNSDFVRYRDNDFLLAVAAKTIARKRNWTPEKYWIRPIEWEYSVDVSRNCFLKNEMQTQFTYTEQKKKNGLMNKLLLTRLICKKNRMDSLFYKNHKTFQSSSKHELERKHCFDRIVVRLRALHFQSWMKERKEKKRKELSLSTAIIK